MKRHSMPEVKEGNVNVTPLIDIVMCLIIFFMLVTKICIDDGRGTMDLPATRVGVEIEDRANMISLNVRKGVGDNEALVAVLDPEINRVEEKSTSFPAGAKTSPLIDFLKRVRGNNKDFQVIIRADKSVGYKYIQPVIFACNKAEIHGYSLATSVEYKSAD